MQYHKLRICYMGMHNQCWIGLCQYVQITYIFCYHHIHLSIKSSLHLLYLLVHWNSVQMPALVHSILVACWKRTLYLPFCYQQISLGLCPFQLLYLAKSFLFLLCWPWEAELSFFLVLLTLAHLFHIRQHRVIAWSRQYFWLFSDSLYYQIYKILYPENLTLLYLNSRSSLSQTFFVLS